MRIQLFLLFGLLCVSPSLLFAQSTATPIFISDSLDTYVNREMKRWDIPGAAVLVVKNGKVIAMKGYGLRELGKPERVDEHTLFMIGSNTKAFTGTALALLEAEGKCNLNDKVQKWLPKFTMKDPWVAQSLSLTDILCHRIGMETFQGDFMYWTSDLTAPEAVQKFGQLTPLYDFRTQWGYTNLGFVLAGECLSAISGKTWDSFVRERLFKPLQMNNSLALATEIVRANNAARAHTYYDGVMKVAPYGMIDNLAPAGSISSSVNDLSHWVIAQLDSGRYANEQAIPFDVIKRTRYPESIQGRRGHAFNRRHYSLYALGWALEDYEAREIVSHTGGVNGFVTSVTLVPEEKLGIVVLTNTDQNSFYEALKWEILDAYLGLPYRNYSQRSYGFYSAFMNQKRAQEQSWRDSVKLNPTPGLSLKDYAGHYTHEVYGHANLKLDGNHLVLTLEHHPNLIAKLEALGGHRFLCTFNDPLFGTRVFPFSVKDKKVLSFTLNVDDFVEFTTYEFKKG